MYIIGVVIDRSICQIHYNMIQCNAMQLSSYEMLAAFPSFTRLLDGEFALREDGTDSSSTAFLSQHVSRS